MEDLELGRRCSEGQMLGLGLTCLGIYKPWSVFPFTKSGSKTRTEFRENVVGSV